MNSIINLNNKISRLIQILSSKNSSDLSEMELANATSLLAETAKALSKNSSSHKAILEITKELGNTPGFSNAAQIIAKKACEVANADSSEIFLYDKQNNRFKLEAKYSIHAYSENDTFEPKDPPRSTEGTTYKILTTGEPLKINDIEIQPDIKHYLRDIGLRSIIGVCIRFGTENIGVLYVRGFSPNQFTGTDVDVLDLFANQVAIFFSWSRFLFTPAEDIDKAIAKLSQMDLVLHNFCHEIQDNLGFEFSAVQLIRQQENVIETAYSLDAAEKHTGEKHTGLAKHYLTSDHALQDIQADIAQAKPLRIEIIKGWDKRFDKWIFKELHHDKVVRVWLPIVLVRDAAGNIKDDWVDDLEYKIVLNEEHSNRKHIVIHPKLPYENIKVLGTIDAGHIKKSTITPEEAMALFKLTSHWTSKIYQCSLPYVFQTIADHARTIVGADSASLHFLPMKTEDDEYYAHEIFSGPISQYLLDKSPIRQEGLGRIAMETGEPQYTPDSNKDDPINILQTKNPNAFNNGIKAMAAFPLLVNKKQGVLYIHYNKFHNFSKDELNWVALFANKAVGAIRRATNDMQLRDNARQLANLHEVSKSLVKAPEDQNLLKRIAGSTANLLGADIVTIYEYFESDRNFVHQPALAGRLKQKNIWQQKLLRHHFPCNSYNEEKIYLHRM
ncbi:GAF domain-containing protein [Candidatus Venteria ishoeyi]|uniref:Fused phosphoenolpyruvate-protein phosphotransferase PtsP/GAF domain protein n=1 Tax=Candidatus Venteria ishoeyi TaxID=1899563 RepID=A0A1H6FGC7_9GAMM|nr:GAF domain-containing protein [Candidatus Venteria ishoeyi]SEH08054.1 fused phosphoenolpyruvate-protein phosphotransferase PtsP/GAF domain protein [Candidatus Venteria ishoeyi]